MEKTISKYNSFKEAEHDVWKSRFIWRGLNGKDPKYTTTINKFFAETKVLETVEVVNTAYGFFNFSVKMADEYVKWVNSKGTAYKKSEYDDMKNFFIGAMGEFFFVELLNEVKCLMAYNPQDKEFVRYDFNYVSPSLPKDKDFGIDLTGVANDVPSVFQVKFWNPFSTKSIPIEVFQKADSEGSRNEFISQADDNNIFLCTLCTEGKGYMAVKDNKVYKNKIVIIGERTLEASVNGRNNIFWTNLFKKLAEVGSLA